MARDRSLKLKLVAINRMSAVIDKVQKAFPKLTRSISRASRVSKIFNAQTKQMRAGLAKVGGALKGFGRTLTLGLTLPILVAGVASVKFFGNFEQGLKGIEKTTGITGTAIEKLGRRFDQLSTEIPVSTVEMLALAQAGGQLGIKGVKNIEKFTIVMAKLSRASDVAGEAGAKSIARILKVTGTAIDKVDRFSAALVDLGNNAAASESEILEVATRVAGQIGRFDVAAESVLGISTALRALGKRAESAGSVIGRAFDAIDQSIKGGGKQVMLLSRLTGVAVKNLKKEFQVNAAKVFQKFIVGLAKVESGGGNLIKVMGALGLQGVRINDILGTLAKRPEVLAENMDRASKAFRENIALEKEFLIQTSSLNSAMIIISNTFKSLLVLIGQELAPAVRFFGKIFKGFLDFLRNNPAIRTLVIVFGALAAILGPVLFLIGALTAAILPMVAASIFLDIALLPIIGTVLAVMAAIAALIVVSVILVKKWDAIKNFFSENPFIQFAKFLFFILTPLGQVITFVRLLIAAFKGLDAIKNVIKGVLPNFIGDRIFGKANLGPEKGAKTKNKEIGQSKTDFFSGVLDVNFRNAPEGTNIKAKTQGPLDFNLGFAGGIQ